MRLIVLLKGGAIATVTDPIDPSYSRTGVRVLEVLMR
jgi:hypothetical protein